MLEAGAHDCEFNWAAFGELELTNTGRLQRGNCSVEITINDHIMNEQKVFHSYISPSELVSEVRSMSTISW